MELQIEEYIESGSTNKRILCSSQFRIVCRVVRDRLKGKMRSNKQRGLIDAPPPESGTLSNEREMHLCPSLQTGNLTLPFVPVSIIP